MYCVMHFIYHFNVYVENFSSYVPLYFYVCWCLIRVCQTSIKKLLIYLLIMLGSSLTCFLANMNSCSRSLHVVVRPSVVCNVRAPYSGDWNFRQCFYAIWYLGHLRPFGKNFMEIVPGEPLHRGIKPKRGRKCNDFGPFQGYISETVQDRR